MKKIPLLYVLLILLNSGCLLAQSSHAVPKNIIRPDYLTGEEKRAAKIYLSVLPTAVTIFTTRYVVKEQGMVKQEALGKRGSWYQKSAIY